MRHCSDPQYLLKKDPKPEALLDNHFFWICSHRCHRCCPSQLVIPVTSNVHRAHHKVLDIYRIGSCCCFDRTIDGSKLEKLAGFTSLLRSSQLNSRPFTRSSLSGLSQARSEMSSTQPLESVPPLEFTMLMDYVQVEASGGVQSYTCLLCEEGNMCTEQLKLHTKKTKHKEVVEGYKNRTIKRISRFIKMIGWQQPETRDSSWHVLLFASTSE